MVPMLSFSSSPRRSSSSSDATGSHASYATGSHASSARQHSWSAFPVESVSPSSKAVVDLSCMDDKVLGDLDPRYFTQHFDPVANILDSLPLDGAEVGDFLQAQIGALDLAKDVVTSKLAEDVQRNYTSFIQGMKQVQDVDLDLTLALIQVKNGRRLLASAKQDLVINHLELVKLRRNRDRLQTIVDHCAKILSFFRLEQDLLSFLQDKDYARAVDVCIDMRHQLSRVVDADRFSILRSVRHRMAQALPELRQHFDAALVGLLEDFDATAYGNLLRATAAVEAHHPGAPSSVPQVVVRGIEDLARQHVQSLFVDAAPLSGRQNKLSPSVAIMLEDLLGCFEKLVALLHGYYLFVQWHRDPFSDKNTDAAYLHRCDLDSPDESSNQSNDELLALAARHADAFQQYRRLVWEQMQQSAGDLLDRFPLTPDFKLEHLVALSHATQQFMAIGDAFGGHAASAKLAAALGKKCRAFLKSQHKDNIELLRMLFDTEKWERLAVPIDNHSGGIPALLEQRSGYSLPDVAAADAVRGLSNPRPGVFVNYKTKGNPFALCHRPRLLDTTAMQRYAFEKRREDPLADDEDQLIKRMIALDPYLRGDADDAASSPQQEELIRYGSKHVVSSSSLSGFLRLCGVHLKLMEQLPHVAWEVFLDLAALFDFVFYATLTTACPDNYLARLLTRQTPSDLRCEELRQQLGRVQSDLGLGLTAQSVPVRVTQLPLAIASAGEANRFALVERVVAIEALGFQWHVFQSLHRESLAPLVDAGRRDLMATMMATMAEAVAEARSYIYAVMAPSLISAAAIPAMIEKATWDPLDLSDQHNEYVVALVRMCGMFWGTLQGSAVPIPVRDEIWSYVVRAIMEALVEGYANVKKCSMEGRALMSMDLIALQNGLDLINHVSNQDQSLWGRSYVNNYIKAYYLQEKELLAFIAANKKNYRKAHLVSLALNGVCGMRRNAQKDLLQKIELVCEGGHAGLWFHWCWGFIFLIRPSPLNMACIGIDLGTTHACVGVHFNGKVSIIANDQGFRTTPCVVAFETEDVVVGDSAVAKLHNNAANTVYHLKRVLGKKHTDVKSLDYIKGWSFDVKADAKGHAVAAVTHKDAAREVSATEFAGLVLTKLKDLAEDYTGVKIANCVLSVPQEFSDEQKALMNEAAKAAGIDVMRYISEPIAAAIAYGFDESKSIDTKLIVVVDIGGASSDMSLLSADKGLFNVVGHVGDDALGGEDFTYALVEHCVKTFERQKKVVLKDNTRALYRIKLACEQAKKSLSTQSQVTIEVDSLAEGQDLIVKLSRSRFEEMIGDHVRKVVSDISALLENANMDKESIDHVILAGGSTRIPKVQQAIEDFFDGKKASSTISPDEVIAYGATLEAATLSETADWDNLPSDPLNMVEAVPLTLSLGLADGSVYEMITRNTILPATTQEVFTTHVDNQKAVYLQVYEGQRLMARDNTLLANLTISGIPPMEKGAPEIEVSFNVTRKSVLTVKAHLRNAEGAASKALTVQSDSKRVVDVNAIVAAAEAAADEDDELMAELEAAAEAAELAAAIAAAPKGVSAGEDMD
ncbi:hsp70-like protein [Achlya hypogyna]|uniref:Hsp70-like protein n=1 Tax=Achlya hypogyna TaxID=1202772 RepID=A0A1V9YIR9_ACHHY|nr:hsp70-like protein [Achlya hypogyna]